MSKEQVKKFFGTNAAAYATSKVHAQGASLARVRELVQPQPHWRALDVATAAGHTAFIFAPHVDRVVASDITPEMLEVAANLAAEKGITNVTFEEADAEQLPFDSERFDLVTCRIAPHHFPHIERFIAESARVLRQGGILAVVDNISPDDETASVVYNAFEKQRDPSHGRCWSLDEWRAAFVAAGFELLHSETAIKEMAFNSWTDRMGVAAETKAQLRTLLQEGPEQFRAFLQPQVGEDDILFYLTEAIVIGRKA
jgi:ubiquinone/menaquinone biosynthesis C-methylase UbiE